MKKWESSITEVLPGSLTTQGHSQLDLIRDARFEDIIFLLLRGDLPSASERELLRAVLVSHVSHGLTGQSTLAVRMAADCRSGFFNALVAGFSTGAGPYHQGGLEATMRELSWLAGLPEQEQETAIETRLDEGGIVFGYGHRFHKDGDPRAAVLLMLADSLGFNCAHVAAAKRAENVLLRRKGIRMNIEAAGGAILLDLGFSPQIAHLFIVLGRGPMFAAAYQERLADGSRPFPKIHVFDEN